MVEFSGFASFLIYAADFTGEKKSGRDLAGVWESPFNGQFKFRFEAIKALFSLKDLFLKLIYPPSMGEVPGPDQRDPLFFTPQDEMLGVQIPGCGPGKVGVNMQVGNEFHAGDYSLSGHSCQPYRCETIERRPLLPNLPPSPRLPAIPCGIKWRDKQRQAQILILEILQGMDACPDGDRDG